MKADKEKQSGYITDVMLLKRKQPMSFWTEQDVLKCLAKYKITYSLVCGEIKKDKNGEWHTTAYNRTGYIF